MFWAIFLSTNHPSKMGGLAKDCPAPRFEPFARANTFSPGRRPPDGRTASRFVGFVVFDLLLNQRFQIWESKDFRELSRKQKHKNMQTCKQKDTSNLSTASSPGRTFVPLFHGFFISSQFWFNFELHSFESSPNCFGRSPVDSWWRRVSARDTSKQPRWHVREVTRRDTKLVPYSWFEPGHSESSPQLQTPWHLILP